eukprot:5599954-Pyramimonas_sp.AAC.1
MAGLEPAALRRGRASRGGGRPWGSFGPEGAAVAAGSGRRAHQGAPGPRGGGRRGPAACPAALLRGRRQGRPVAARRGPGGAAGAAAGRLGQPAWPLGLLAQGRILCAGQPRRHES